MFHFQNRFCLITSDSDADRARNVFPTELSPTLSPLMKNQMRWIGPDLFMSPPSSGPVQHFFVNDPRTTLPLFVEANISLIQSYPYCLTAQTRTKASNNTRKKIPFPLI
jgi:hypothetical protein